MEIYRESLTSCPYNIILISIIPLYPYILLLYNYMILLKKLIDKRG